MNESSDVELLQQWITGHDDEAKAFEKLRAAQGEVETAQKQMARAHAGLSRGAERGSDFKRFIRYDGQLYIVTSYGVYGTFVEEL